MINLATTEGQREVLIPVLSPAAPPHCTTSSSGVTQTAAANRKTARRREPQRRQLAARHADLGCFQKLCVIWGLCKAAAQRHQGYGEA
jgi:hypothetical protein